MAPAASHSTSKWIFWGQKIQDFVVADAYNVYQLTARFVSGATFMCFELMPTQCSGLLPCTKCVRRGQCCTYLPAQSGTILIENGRHFTPTDMLSISEVAPLCVRVNVRHFDRFFEVFVTTNNFSCAASVWMQYLRTSIGRDAMVATAIIAVGALHMYKTMQVDSKDESLLKRALNEYQKAVNALRKSLSLSSGDVDLCSTMSATFLLGLFEVGDLYMR
jgi:hypothetical protein